MQDPRLPPLVLLPAYVRDAGKQERHALDVVHADAMHVCQLRTVYCHVHFPIVYPDVGALLFFPPVIYYRTVVLKINMVL